MAGRAVAMVLGLLTLWGCSESQDVPLLRRSTQAKRAPEEKANPAPVSKARPGGPSPWTYLMPVDHGIRADGAGSGEFRASRRHGQHNGLDLLAKVGTPVVAICDGEARKGDSPSFGKWVQVLCPVPPLLAGEKTLYTSMFYAHLSSTANAVETDWALIDRGVRVGAVGKTGNARGSTVAPHLHFEMIVHDSEEHARAERHSGRDQSNNAGAKLVAARLETECLKPAGFTSHKSPTRARRVDPFLVMTCVGVAKPEYAPPKEESLAKFSVSWASKYDAAAFDVEKGWPF